MEIKPYPAEENIEWIYNTESLSPVLNFLFGYIARFNIEQQIVNSLKKINLHPKKRSMFTFFGFLQTAIMNEDLLDSINPLGYYHDHFGEGFDDKRKKTGNTFKSYLFTLPDNRLIHIGFDHRGTSVYLPIDITEKEFYEIVDWIITVCYNFNEKEFMEYYDMCNKTSG